MIQFFFSGMLNLFLIWLMEATSSWIYFIQCCIILKLLFWDIWLIPNLVNGSCFKRAPIFKDFFAFWHKILQLNFYLNASSISLGKSGPFWEFNNQDWDTTESFFQVFSVYRDRIYHINISYSNITIKEYFFP